MHDGISGLWENKNKSIFEQTGLFKRSGNAEKIKLWQQDLLEFIVINIFPVLIACQFDVRAFTDGDEKK